MSAGLWWQYIVIAVLVAISLAYTLRKIMPRLGVRARNGGDCDSGCGSCGGCGTSSGPSPSDAQPLEFRPRRH